LDRTITEKDVNTAPGHAADKELDVFIAKRDKQRRDFEEGVRPAEAPWAASERRENARRRRELDQQWFEYHRDAAQRHMRILEDLVAHHEAKAERYAQRCAERGAHLQKGEA